MSQDKPLTQRQIHQHAMRLSTYEDGLWDMLTGAIFLLLGIFPLTREWLGRDTNLIVFLIVLAILVGVFQLIKHIFVTPRLGIVKVRPTVSSKALLVFSILLVLFSLVLVAIALFGPQKFPRPDWGNVPQWVRDLDAQIIASLLVIVVFSVLAYLFNVRRIYLYAWMIGIGNLASSALMQYAGFTYNLPLVVASSIILIVGVVLFIRFLQKYPIPAVESQDEHDLA